MSVPLTTESIRTTEPARTAGLVVGIGMSSRATAAEVRELVERTFGEHGLDAHRIALIATRDRFVEDDRLRLGVPVLGIDDAWLEAMSEPCTRTVGIRARVAETAARLAADLALAPPAATVGPTDPVLAQRALATHDAAGPIDRRSAEPAQGSRAAGSTGPRITDTAQRTLAATATAPDLVVARSAHVTVAIARLRTSAHAAAHG